jgi:3-oxoacyl-[acyl-carrier protein] reductase
MKKIVLITGTNRGIGLALLKKYSKSDSFIILAHARKASSDFEEMIRTLAIESNAEIIPVYFELTDYKQINEVIKKIKEQFTYLDILINNAGVAHGGTFQMTPIDDIKNVFEINLFATMKLTQNVIRIMRRNSNSSIVNISSISGLDLNKGNCAYGVSKAALNAFTVTLSKELNVFGIRVNAVTPGLTDTNMAKQMDDKAYVEMINRSAMMRLGKTSEIANLVYFLTSDEASFINGQIIRCDGGSI